MENIYSHTCELVHSKKESESNPHRNKTSHLVDKWFLWGLPWPPCLSHEVFRWLLASCFSSKCYVIFGWFSPYSSFPILNQVFSKHFSKTAYFQYFSIDALTGKQFPLNSSDLRSAFTNGAGDAHKAIIVVLSLTQHFCHNRAKWQLLLTPF